MTLTLPHDIMQLKYHDVKLIVFTYCDIRSVHLILHDKGVRKGRKPIHIQIYP